MSPDATPSAQPRLSRWASVLLALVAVMTFMSAATPASAHDTTTHALTIFVEDGRIVGTGLVEFGELGLEDTTGDGLIDQEELTAQNSSVAATLVATAQDHIELTANGSAVSIIGAGLGMPEETTASGGSEYVGLAFASEQFEGDLAALTVAWDLPSPSDSVVVSDADNAVVGHLGDDGTVTFTLDGGSTASSFFGQGIEHIRLGFDHLLFLVVLTLGVVGARPNRASLWRVIKLVTAFTIGHAVSLCLAYFNVLPVPAAIVEPAIALSIVAVAALAVWRKMGPHPWWIAGLIGVVHGLGFASSLAGLGLATSNHVVALLTFNVGIDVAQVAVVGAVLGAYALLGRFVSPRVLGFVRIGVCIAIGVVGLFWAVTRVATFVMG